MASTNIAPKLRIFRFFLREGAAHYFYTRNKNDGLIISDEGFLHRLLSYSFSNELDVSEVSSYIDKCPVSDLVIALLHDQNTIHDRRDVESDPFCEIFNITHESARIKELNTMNKNLEKILDGLQEANIKVLKIEVNTSAGDFLNQIYDHLPNHIR